MRAWLPAVAAGCLLSLLALGAASALRPGAPTTDAARADALARELRCPDCQGLSVADSPTRSAQEIRRQIDELVAGGATDAEVREHFVARYGEWIRLSPSAPAYWLVPFAVLLAGAAALAVWLLRRRPASADAPVLTAEERRSLREDAEALDA